MIIGCQFSGGGMGYALANPLDAAGQAASTNGVGTAFELSFWESVANSNDRAQLEAYLAQYPNGTFSGLARAKIAALPAAVTVTPAAAPIAPVVPAVVTAPTVAAPVAATPASLPVTPAMVVAQPAPVTATSPASLLEQFSVLGKESVVSAPALFAETGGVPARPVLTPVDTLDIPDHFCSAVERNSFHDSVYVPAVAMTDRNNEATIAHLTNVRALHAQALAASNIPNANALAREATAFKPTADQAYQARAAMADLFGRIMATPITGC